MTSCYDGSILCQNPLYPDFDDIAAQELLKPPTVNEIINQSAFCTMLPINAEDIIGDLTSKLFLKGLKSKNGIYHLWIDFDGCSDHETFTMECIYVGKGFAEGRINDHIKKKSENLKNKSLYATFHPCSNRMSKYLEQLFLDTYNFELNEYENPGTEKLYAVWDNERHLIGTELNQASSLSSIQCFEDL